MRVLRHGLRLASLGTLLALGACSSLRTETALPFIDMPPH